MEVVSASVWAIGVAIVSRTVLSLPSAMCIVRTSYGIAVEEVQGYHGLIRGIGLDITQ